MGRRASRHAKLAAQINQNNKSVKRDAGKNVYQDSSRKNEETQRILEKYGIGRNR